MRKIAFITGASPALGARILTAAVLVHICTAWFSAGHYHADEYAQLLGYAAYKLDIISAEELPHEYGSKLRGTFMPFIAFATVKIMQAAGIDSPFMHAFALRFLSAVLALAAAAAFWSVFGKEIKNDKTRFWILISLLFLYPLVFYRVRFSAEGWMMSFLLLALAAHYRADKTSAAAPAFAAGLLLGLMFLARYQGGLVVLPLALWVIFIRRESWRRICLYGGGFLAAQVFGFLSDAWFYKAPVFPWLEYLKFHAAEDIRSPPPWYVYFTRAAAILPPAGLFAVLLPAVFYWKFPRHPFTWATTLYFAFHLAVENKQTRFLAPLVPFLPPMFALLWEKYAAAAPRAKLWTIRGLKLSAACNIPMLAFVMFFPASKEAALLQDCIAPRILGKSAAIYVADKNSAAVSEINLGFYGVSHADFIYLKNGADFTPPADADVVLFASRKARITPPENINADLICRALPEWVEAFNFNNWLSRASVWRVWETAAVL